MLQANMMRQRFAPTRRAFLRGGLAVAGLGLLSGCAAASPIGPQRQARLPRIGYLWSGEQEWADGFREGLADLGYVEGRTIIVEWRPADGQVERSPGWPPSWWACPSTCSWPPGPAHPGRDARHQHHPDRDGMRRTTRWTEGFVASLARPGGNVTGQTSISRELIWEAVGSSANGTPVRVAGRRDLEP